MNRRRLARSAFALAALPALALTTAPAFAAWPDKPVRIVVTFAAGGASDIVARAISDPLAKALGQPVIVDNKPGAGGNLGVDAVAKSPADGYTIVIGQTSNLAINPTLYSKMPYDSQRDLAPIVLLANARW